MTDQWFDEWVALHCKHTAADAMTASTLISNREVITGRWHATYRELCECTDRLVGSGHTPKFPNEHLDAIHTALDDLRRDELRAAIPERPNDGQFDTDCNLCGGSGFVTVPHPRCVWHGRLVLCQGRVEMCAVICDADGCTAGRRTEIEEDKRDSKKHARRPMLARYRQIIGGADGLALLAGYERDLWAQTSNVQPFGGDPTNVWGKLVVSIQKRVRS